MERSWIASAFPRDDERGLAAVFVGLWIVVLIGFGAFALDTSRIYNEHSELRNGADAAALAVARDCAWGLCSGFYDEVYVAEGYADANMRDGTALVEDVAIDLANRTVEVDVATEDVPGDNNFDMVLAQVIGYDGLTVRADATVEWGYPSGLRTLPLAFSKCEWEAFGEPGYVYNGGFLHHADSVISGEISAPKYKYDDAYVTIYFHGRDDDDATVCHDSPSGADLSGGFGWLDSNTGRCEAKTKKGDWAPIDPGASPTNECAPHDIESVLGEVVQLPYFGAVDGENPIDGRGAGGSYLIHGYGSLFVTGYNFGGQYKENSTITHKAVCKGEERCIEGYMIGDWVTSGATGLGGPNLGLLSIELRD